jgi:lipid II:glycine glycyltransferase (peptidoglycan interpeptide bridge formation enzyme)
MKRNRSVAKYPLQWFEALHEILIHQKKADILFAVKGDEYAAGVVIIYSPTSNHYLHNGSDQTLLESRPNDLLVDQVIQDGLKEGKTTLDFMGSDANDLPLLRFKEKWGSRSLDLYTYVKDYHPIRCRIWEVGKRLGNSRIGNRLLKKIRD